MSFAQCSSSPTYHTSVEQKLVSRNAAKQYKYGSPKLRDMLREKCRLRVREARRSSFDGARNAGKVGDNTLVSKILRQELADLESDLDLQEHIYGELIGEMDMWFYEQLEEQNEYLIEVGDANVVFCPVCKKTAIEQASNQQMVCQCGVCGTLQDLHVVVQDAIGQHDAQCSEQLHIFVEQNSTGNQKTLNAMCENCDFFVGLT